MVAQQACVLVHKTYMSVTENEEKLIVFDNLVTSLIAKYQGDIHPHLIPYHTVIYVRKPLHRYIKTLCNIPGAGLSTF